MAGRPKRYTVSLPADAHVQIKVHCAGKRLRMGDWLAAVGIDAVNADKKKVAK